jgi:Protein of unknown function (DUF4235)
MTAKRPDLTARVAAGLAGAAAAFAVRKVLQAGWKLVTGREAPDSPEDPEVSLGEAVTWALVLGAAVAAARIVATRYTAGKARTRS